MICIVGAGKMGKALATGFLASGLDPRELTLVDRHRDRHAELARKFCDVYLSTVPVSCEGAVIATKPEGIEAATRDAVSGGAERIVSVAAGIPLARIAGVADGVPVARAMPNVGVSIGRSTTSVWGTDDSIVEWTRALMGRVGTVVTVPESDFDVATALGGSGPAFVALVAEALIAAGVDEGLDEDTAHQLVVNMVASTSALMHEHHLAPRDLREMVSTPNGTTLAGLAALEHNEARRVMATAVRSATARSKELAR